jgi:hypothetical protein
MKIRLRRHGGFAAIPGLGVDVEVDTATLPAEVAAPLESAATAARADIADPPATDGPNPARRDGFTYDLEIEDAAGPVSAQLSDPLPGPAVRDLVQALLNHRPPPSSLGDPS